MLGSRKFFEGAGERKSPNFSGTGEAGGVGRHEGEGIVGVFFVLCEMEGDPAHAAPLRGVLF